MIDAPDTEIEEDADPALPRFSLTAYDDLDGNVQITTTVPSKPNIRKPVSLALLFGLAILTLDDDGTIEARMEALLAKGMLNEVDAVNRIAQLTTKDPL